MKKNHFRNNERFLAEINEKESFDIEKLQGDGRTSSKNYGYKYLILVTVYSTISV